MASFSHRLLLFSSLFVFLVSLSFAQTSFRPSALVLPVTKDNATRQYVTSLNQRTPLVPVRLTLDIGGRFLWVDCDSGYVSSTYRPARCRSSQCSLANTSSCGNCFGAPRPGCNNNTCGLFPENTVTRTSTGGELTADVVSVSSTNGSNPGRVATVSDFLFSCAPTSLLQGLARGVTGIAGLGRTRIALPSQFASAFNFSRKFALCLSSSNSFSGVLFFGDGSYTFLPGIDASSSLTYTPLIINPVSNAGATGPGEASDEYFIGVTFIQINGKTIPLNSSLLTINNEGVGGTKVSTIDPYTVLETSIYNAVVSAFVSEFESMNITRVASVAPFGACFSSENIGSTRVGPAVPLIDLVLHNSSISWRIFGANSMVAVNSTEAINNDVLCLAFVDGGSSPRTSIVIGGYQLEDNLLEIDLASSRLGFTSSLLYKQTTCANFNFTSNA
ncbi:probable aspartic proteinase GIP2 [Aristolochia californica]|uniref:probable aspartic proteinase GIP2 n=1 Tax=Aristolochia californica TaxID=171875 RepID=UPI0035E23316